MLEQLAKRHKDFVKVATQICGDRYLADDLVQEMYIKVHELNKEVNDGYIWFILRSIYINYLRKEKQYADFEIDPNRIETEAPESHDLEDFVLSELYKRKGTDQIIIMGEMEHGHTGYSKMSGISRYILTKKRNEFKKHIWQQLKNRRDLFEK